MQGFDAAGEVDAVRDDATQDAVFREPKGRVALTSHLAEIERWVGEGKSDEWIARALSTSRASVQSFRSRRGLLRRSSSPERPDSETPDSETPDSEESLPENPPVSAYEGVLEHGGEEGYGLWLDPAVAEDPVFQRGFEGVADVRVEVREDCIVLTRAGATSRREPAEVSGDSGRQHRDSGGVSLREAAEEARRSSEERGAVKWYDPDRGFGFIRRPGGEDIFLHKSQLDSMATAKPGAEVVYRVGRNKRGPMAEDVRRPSSLF